MKSAVRRSRRALLAGVCLAGFACAHDPITTNLTWSKEISRLVYKRCAGCHQDGGSAMPLVTWEQARPWAKAIRDEVANRRMPPWGAVPGVGDFKGDRSLSAPEIQMLIAWVEGGAPEGDRAFLPSHIPALAAAATLPRHSRSTILSGSEHLASAATLVAIRAPGATDVWVTAKDGAVTRLLWIPQPSRYFHGPYVYEDPVRLAAGSTLHVSGRALLYFR